jgi:hypothetical protein
MKSKKTWIFWKGAGELIAWQLLTKTSGES